MKIVYGIGCCMIMTVCVAYSLEQMSDSRFESYVPTGTGALASFDTDISGYSISADGKIDYLNSLRQVTGNIDKDELPGSVASQSDLRQFVMEHQKKFSVLGKLSTSNTDKDD